MFGDYKPIRARRLPLSAAAYAGLLQEAITYAQIPLKTSRL